MRKTGLQMLLSSMGIEIEPEELTRKYNEAKDIVPKLAAFVTQLDERLKRIEEKLDAIDTRRNGTIERGNFGRTIPSDIDSYPTD